MLGSFLHSSPPPLPHHTTFLILKWCYFPLVSLAMVRKRSGSRLRMRGRDGSSSGEAEESVLVEGGTSGEEVRVDVSSVPRWMVSTVLRLLVSSWYVVSPVLTSLFAIAVIVLCNRLARLWGQFPAWMETPAISFTYYAEPNHSIAASGFFLVMCLFFVMMTPFISVAFVAVERPLLWRVYATGFLAALAFILLFLQAAIPMQSDSMELIDPPLGQSEEDVPRLKPQTILHQLCAVGFFLSAMGHGITVLWLLYDSKTVPVAKKHFAANWWAKAISLAAVIGPASISFFYHPGSGADDARRATVELAGVTQWGAVGSVIAFFAFYSADFYVIRNFILQHKQVLINANLWPSSIPTNPTPATTTPSTDSATTHPLGLSIAHARDVDSATPRDLMERVLTLDRQVFV